MGRFLPEVGPLLRDITSSESLSKSDFNSDVGQNLKRSKGERSERKIIECGGVGNSLKSGS